MKFHIDIDRVAVLRPGDELDIEFVPPLVRRRLSPLQRAFFHLARKIGAESAPLVVFASKNGEDTLTRRIVAEYNSDGSVSPQRFSSSVYNAAPGSWSILNRNTSPYTAIAADEDTAECGFLELAGAPDGAVLVCAEETGGCRGVAFRIGSANRLFTATALDNTGETSVSLEDFVSFADGEVASLSGKWLRLEKV